MARKKNCDVLPINLTGNAASDPVLKAICLRIGKKYWVGRELLRAGIDVSAFIERWKICYCIHHLIRKQYSSKHKMPYVVKEYRNVVKKTAQLFNSVFELLEKAYALNLFPNSFWEFYDNKPLLVWTVLLWEGSLGHGGSETNGLLTKTDFIEILQSQNRQLRSLEDNYKFPDQYTDKFLHYSTIAANRSDIFRRDFYNPMLNARTEMIKAIRSEGTIFLKETNEIIPPGTRGKTKINILEEVQKKCTAQTPVN